MKNVIFDFAGVIAKYDQDEFLDSFNFEPNARAKIDETFSSEAFKFYQMGEISRDDYYTLMIFRFPEFSKEFKAIKKADYAQLLEPNQELLKYIESLKAQGTRVFIMSNTTPETADVILKSDYAQLFDGLIFSTDTHVLKPDEVAYKIALEYFKLNPAETIFVDDNKKNIASAKKLGITGVHFTSTNQAIAEINKQLEQKTLS